MLRPDAREFGLERFAYYADNPRAFVHDNFRDPQGNQVELEPEQGEILDALAAGHDTTVRSGHGVGKTTTDSFALFWFLATRPFSKVPTTAPTFRQVKDILWSEVAKWFQNFRLKDNFELQRTRLSVKGAKDTWFAIGVASNRQENIEGFHAPHVLFIVDEAKGVQKPIFDSIDGALTTGGQRLYTSTPGSRAGQFYESHFGKVAKFFHQIHINGEHSRRVSDKWRKQKQEEWGRDSPIYQAKVLGEFPNEGTDILIRLDWVLSAEDAFDEADCATCGKAIGDTIDAEARRLYCSCETPAIVPAIPHTSRRAIGADIARFGMDDTAAACGSSHRFDWIESWARFDTVETSRRLAELYRREASAPFGCVGIAVDDTGLGGGVTDQLKKIHQIQTTGIIFGAKQTLITPDQLEHFSNDKAHIAWKFRKALEENWLARERGEVGTFGLVRDDRLKGQLSNLRQQQTRKGQIRIIDPDDPEVPVADLPKGVRVSPDRAHAAIICYHAATSAGGPAFAKTTKPDPRTAPRERGPRRVSDFIFGRRRW